MANVNNDRGRKSELKRSTLRQNNTRNDNNSNNNNNTINNDNNINNYNNNNNKENNRTGVVGKSLQGTSSSTPADKQPKKPSLVREGLGADNKPKPKAKIPPTRRGPNPSVSGGNKMKDGGTDPSNRGGDRPYNNNYNNDNDNGSTSLNEEGDASRDPNDRTSAGVVESNQKSKGGKKVGPQDVQSVRQRYYQHADMDGVLQDKIATQLRDNGVSETKLASLSAKIAQAVRDDVMMERKGSAPLVVSNLTSAVTDHLDPILHNSRHHTDLGHIKAHDTSELSQIVLIRIAQVHEELEACKSSLDKALQNSRRPAKDGDPGPRGTVDGGGGGGDAAITTPREHGERSVVVAIQDGVEEQKTNNEILAEQLTRLERNRDDVDQLTQKHTQEVQSWDDENLQLKRYLTEADQDNETLVAKVKEQQQDNDRLQKTLQASRKDVDRLHKQIEDMVAQGHVSGKELASLQSEKARLQVLCDQRYKEILHLRDPDRDLLYQIRALKEEVTSLRTQARRLTEEKGLLRAKTQKMEAALDESLKQRNKVATERDSLFKESQDIRQKYRKLTLATPAQRTLPEIMTPRTRSTSRNSTLLMSTRNHSRADSSVQAVKNSLSEDGNSDSKLATHREEEEASNNGLVAL